jgi:putative transposase
VWTYVSASSISRINQTLDEELKKFATRHLDEEYPYLILDALYEKVREDGVVRTRAVMIDIAINWDGRRSVVAVELANRQSTTSWRESVLILKQSGAGLAASLIRMERPEVSLHFHSFNRRF